MLSEISKQRKEKAKQFQVLFLRNDSSQDVEVHEVKEVDFLTVQEHLEHGESVFITRKFAQKIRAPRNRRIVAPHLKTRLVSAFYVERV